MQATGLAAPRVVKASPAAERIRIGMIGLGIRGFGLFRTLLEMPDVDIPVGCDLYDGHLEAASEVTGNRIEVTKDYRKVVDRKDLDAVLIATPDHWHVPMVLDA